MLYFGEVLKGMRESDKDHRAKRAENARMYREFTASNPDATVEQRNQYVNELSGGSNFLRSALPDRELMKQTVDRRQTELSDQDRRRQLDIVRTNNETRDLVIDQASDIALNSEDPDEAIQTFINENSWASSNTNITNALADGSLKARINAQALDKQMKLIQPQIDSWIKSGAKADALPNLLKNVKSPNTFVNEALVANFEGIAENRLNQDINTFLSRARQMPEQMKRSTPDEFSQALDAALAQQGLTRDNFNSGVLEGISADHEDRSSEHNRDSNRQTNRYKQTQLDRAIEQALRFNLTSPDAFAKAVSDIFENQTADEGTGVELESGDIDAIKTIFTEGRNEQIRTEINSGISGLTESDFVRQVQSESFPQFDPDQRKDVIVAMGSAIQSQLVEQLSGADTKGNQNLITGAYAERVFGMTNDILQQLGLPVGDGSIHQAVASSIAMKDPDGEFSLASISMTDVARAIDARMRSNEAYKFAVNAAAGGNIQNLITNNSASSKDRFDLNAAEEFRSFYTTAEADRRLKASNPYDVDNDGDGRSDFYNASAEEAIRIPLEQLKEVSNKVSNTNREAINNIKAQYQATGQLDDQLRESAKTEALSLRKALSSYQGQMITLRKLQSPTTQAYYRMDDRHLMQIRSQLTLIEQEAKVARDLLRQVEEILLGQ